MVLFNPLSLQKFQQHQCSHFMSIFCIVCVEDGPVVRVCSGWRCLEEERWCAPAAAACIVQNTALVYKL